MNASNILKFSNKKKINQNFEKRNNMKFANLVGSDVILGIYSNNLILRSNNTITNFLQSKEIFLRLNC